MKPYSSLAFTVLLLTIIFPFPSFPQEQNNSSMRESFGTTEVTRFVADLNNPNLYDIIETRYAGNSSFLLNIHLRKGFGWPQVATIVIAAESRQLLFATLISERDFTLNNITVVLADDGFLEKGVPSGILIRMDPTNAGTLFYEAFKRTVER